MQKGRKTIIKVPASMAITSESALNDEDLGPNLKKDEFIVNRPTMALALYLLFEKLKDVKVKILSIYSIIAITVQHVTILLDVK